MPACAARSRKVSALAESTSAASNGKPVSTDWMLRRPSFWGFTAVFFSRMEESCYVLCGYYPALHGRVREGVKMTQLFTEPIFMSKPSDMDFDTAQSYNISPVTEIVAELRAGRLVILVDEEDRENEGDLVMAAEFVTPEAINFMVTHARGLVCLTLTEERCRQLDLPLMASRNGTRFGTNFTMS